MAVVRKITTRIAVDGETAYKREMDSVNRALRTMRAEIKESASAFSNQGRNMDTLRDYQKKLQTAYEQTREKVEALEKAVEDSEKKYGENAVKTDARREALSRARAELNRYEADIRDVTVEIAKLSAEEGRAGAGARQLASETEQAGAILDAKAVVLGNLLTDLGRKGVQFLEEIGKTGIEYNAQIESYTMAMTTALGSAEAAAAAIENIKLDAAVTPYSVDTLVRANQLLIAAGESADGARATVMALSDAISATGGGNDELQRMTQNLQQIQNVGKASAMDIKQFQMAGIDVYGVLADYTGKTAEEVSKLTVTYELLSKALQAAAQEGGRYFGANAAQAATLNGQISTLKDNVKTKLGQAFEGLSSTLSNKLLPQANAFVSGLDMEKVTQQVEDFTVAAIAAGGALAALVALKKLNELASGFRTAAVAIREVEGSLTAAAIQQAILNGEMSGTNVLAGLLTGQISASTVAQLGLNAAAALFPGAIIVATITAAALALKKVSNDINRMKEDLVEGADTMEEIQEKMDALKKRKKELEDSVNWGNTWLIFDPQYQEYAATEKALKELSGRYNELAEEAAEAARAEAAHQAWLESTPGKIQTTTEKLEELKEAYQVSLSAARESLEGQFDLFEQVDQVSITSYEDMMKALESQAEYYNGYADNLDMLRELTSAGIGLNEDFIKSLSDGSAKSVQETASIVEGYKQAYAEGGEEAGAAFMESLNSALADRDAAMDRASEAMVKQQKEEIDMVSEELAGLVEQLNMEDAAMAAAQSTASGFDVGFKREIPVMEITALKAGNKVRAAFQKGLLNGSLTMPQIQYSGPIMGSHAAGLDYVPYDGYIAELHRGEMVVPAKMAELMRQGGGRQSQTQINLYPQTVDDATVDYLYQRFMERAGSEI